MSIFGALGKNLNQPRLKFYFGTVSGPVPYATPPCPPLQYHYTHTLMHQHCHMQIHINLLIVVVVVIINTWKEKQTRNKKKKKKNPREAKEKKGTRKKKQTHKEEEEEEEVKLQREIFCPCANCTTKRNTNRKENREKLQRTFFLWKVLLLVFGRKFNRENFVC